MSEREMNCNACHEPISFDAGAWRHYHGDTYCGTGDGATADPRTPCPRCESLWNTTGLRRKRFGCFACLYQWWSLTRNKETDHA